MSGNVLKYCEEGFVNEIWEIQTAKTVHGSKING